MVVDRDGAAENQSRAIVISQRDRMADASAPVPSCVQTVSGPGIFSVAPAAGTQPNSA